MARKKSSGRKKVRRIVGYFLLSFLALLLAAGVWFYARYGVRLQEMQREARRLVEESSEDTFRQAETSLVYDKDGNLISTLKGEKDVYYIGLQDIPTETIELMISIEDKKFYQHRGLDFKAIARAAWALIENKGEITQGGSTITQQLARNIFLTHEETWERKIKEMFLAMELEKQYSKAKIMEFYLNNIYFSNGYYGIQAASFGYFDKSVQELTLSEQAFLCAIPNSPNLYDPYQNPDKTLERRDRILHQMVLDGKLSEEEEAAAKQEEIVLCKKKRTKNNYVETFAYDCAVRALMQRAGFSFQYTFADQEEEEEYLERYRELYRECQTSLYTGGYRIYTSIDQKLQKELQEALDKGLASDNGQNEEGVYELQGAAVTIDNDTGRVVAVVGGRSQELPGYTLNRAFQSYRQPGSSIKPLVVYTPAFEAGYLPEEMAEDKKREDGPRNADGVYAGQISLLQAVAVSKNTVAWDLLEQLTPAKGLSYLLEMNFSRLSEDDYNLAAALGGLTHGVSPVEMASAFASLENRGIYREPTCILKIMDAEGTVLVSEVLWEEKRVYQEGAVEKMNLCLLEAMSAGTGRKGKLDGMPCAGKTGTTNDQKDKWFVGFTAYYTTSVWVGYDLPRSLERLPEQTEPLQIWKTFMEEIHQEKEAIELQVYQIPEPERAPIEELPPPEEEPEETLTDDEEQTGEDDMEDEAWIEDEIDDDIEDIPEEDEGEDEDWNDGWDEDWGDDWDDEGDWDSSGEDDDMLGDGTEENPTEEDPDSDSDNQEDPEDASWWEEDWDDSFEEEPAAEGE
ncbi:MAG: PBP1A family penicillin-binding protein [Lachnospiraceae bacterium]|jgi:penicillin-binding protein 1A|nr:PBP1A family penicillin-binding protein [Lachnospiraceae bacterium]